MGGILPLIKDLITLLGFTDGIQGARELSKLEGSVPRPNFCQKNLDCGAVPWLVGVEWLRNLQAVEVPCQPCIFPAALGQLFPSPITNPYEDSPKESSSLKIKVRYSFSSGFFISICSNPKIFSIR